MEVEFNPGIVTQSGKLCGSLLVRVVVEPKTAEVDDETVISQSQGIEKGDIIR